MDQSEKDVDILGTTEFDLADLVKGQTLEKKLTDPSGSKDAGKLTMSYEEDVVCKDIVYIEASADLKAIGAGCCGGGDNPQLIIER